MIIDNKTYTLNDFDFMLPQELIAQTPSQERSSSRLLDARTVGCDEAPKDYRYSQLPDLLQANDLLIFNNTKVIKARLYGEKISGGKCELLIERILNSNEAAVHLRVSKKPRNGDFIRIYTDDGNTIQAQLLGRWPKVSGPLFHFRFDNKAQLDIYELLSRYGHVPLPPYITHADNEHDLNRYQTVFARHPGAVAAPTAALHFDAALLQELTAKNIASAFVTLHVGAGTFSPVRTENLNEHVMHSEWYHIPDETLVAMDLCREQGGRIVAVGTTTVRTVESWAKTGLLTGDTNIFITPGFQFKIVDMLITNFHLPKSTLMMLVSAFAGYDAIRRVYQTAIDRKYLFFSYGDGMLLQKNI
jgi:S-adenosylmethionine:tRNA ribosyltransferase-isomerase